jgi:hypothetical protein
VIDRGRLSSLIDQERERFARDHPRSASLTEVFGEACEGLATS